MSIGLFSSESGSITSGAGLFVKPPSRVVADTISDLGPIFPAVSIAATS